MLTTGGAKLLDFGLATFRAGMQTAVAGMPWQAVETRPLTRPGAIFGTLPYMAPEQLEGQPADGGADLFAFGAVFFEMVAGRKAFDAPSGAGVVAAILGSEPPALSTQQAPPALRFVVARCLTKKPEDRWQSAADLHAVLSSIGEIGGVPNLPVASTRRWHERVAWTIAVALLLLAVGVLAAQVRRSPPPSSVIRLSVLDPEAVDVQDGSLPVISPDGTRLVFGALPIAKAWSQAPLWVRRFDDLHPALLPGTEDAFSPFWSPDNQSIAFFVGDKLLRVDASGGSPPVNLRHP